ncbi:MAG: hypothetical protein RRZ67_03990 [Victivallaceae bacterium]
MNQRPPIITVIPGILWISSSIFLFKNTLIGILNYEKFPIRLLPLGGLFLIAISIGTAKYIFIFKKIVLKQIYAAEKFSKTFSKRNYLKEIFEIKKILVYSVISLSSIFLRKKLGGEYFFYFLKTAVGSGLFIAGINYFKKLRQF